IDDETAIAIECKSAEVRARRPQFQDELGKHSLIRQRFAQAIKDQFNANHKRQVALAMFMSNIVLSDNDRKRAQESNVILFDEQDLAYYEALVSHLGAAARYQFLADMLPGKAVPGLDITLPAIRARMGGYTCYTFAISPDYLLKISYVSHRAKGKASDVNTYQRMIQKSRLKQIRSYIEGNGIFPTNIVISLDRKPNFARTEQEVEQENGVMGWLSLRCSYKSAWIIDGQHRLFAYSGYDRADKARLAVLAFENLPPSKQAELFIDINAEQRSVKQSLLQELYAELHWNATDPEIRLRAIVSKAIQYLDADPESPFYQRILTADARKDALRCISLTSVFRALETSDLYFAPVKKAGIVEYGPLWGGDDNELTRKRTVYILKMWFDAIKSSALDWWQAGSSEGGGLAMNDGVIACIMVLRSVFQHLTSHGDRLVTLDDDDLFERLKPFAEALGSYLGSLSEQERKSFRDLRGVQGQTTRMRRCQLALHDRIPFFSPPGLKDFIETEKAQTNAQAQAITERIEKELKQTILEVLKQEFGEDEERWWIAGVPQTMRVKVTERFERDDGQRGGKEHYFDLIDYRDIISQHWGLFGPILGFGKASSSKEKRTSWIKDVNEIRKIWAHASSGRSVSLEQLAQLEAYNNWLTQRLNEFSEGELNVDGVSNVGA
ncbi:MAG TPA: DGQHR domain-containing protein, partial [Nitrospira sp.]|nr:DGQHR domain-containing protein [Nitrospira sp.]